MSRTPILPAPPHPPESYESRFNFRIERELQGIKTSVKSLHDGLLSGTLYAIAAPTTGMHAQGDIVRNSNPTEAGAVSSKYVLIGWICTVAGTPGTWLQMRVLTGN